MIYQFKTPTEELLIKNPVIAVKGSYIVVSYWDELQHRAHSKIMKLQGAVLELTPVVVRGKDICDD